MKKKKLFAHIVITDSSGFFCLWLISKQQNIRLLANHTNMGKYSNSLQLWCLYYYCSDIIAVSFFMPLHKYNLQGEIQWGRKVWNNLVMTTQFLILNLKSQWHLFDDCCLLHLSGIDQRKFQTTTPIFLTTMDSTHFSEYGNVKFYLVLQFSGCEKIE